ncbi:hypothetical protein [uncultured Duncaniella sp.]|uniref:hypothetical protein n=1 Tax=uncultured Duncaniella sp. TaxID=2768039 RepID=UPI003526405F
MRFLYYNHYSPTLKMIDTMEEIIDQIQALAASFLKDASAQLDKGNKTAGLRARRASLDM